MNLATGPRTLEGKAVSSQNALRHGFRSAQIVLPGEDAAAYDELVAELTAHHQPACPTSLRAVQELAAAEWRLARARTQIHQLLSAAIQARIQSDPNTHPLAHHTAAQEHLLAESAAFRQLLRFEDKFDRQYHRALKSLTPKRTRKIDTNEPPPPEKQQNEPTISLDKPQIDTNKLPRPSRNAPCPCQSGRKFKRCCGIVLRP